MYGFGTSGINLDQILRNMLRIGRQRMAARFLQNKPWAGTNLPRKCRCSSQILKHDLDDCGEIQTFQVCETSTIDPSILISLRGQQTESAYETRLGYSTLKLLLTLILSGMKAQSQTARSLYSVIVWRVNKALSSLLRLKITERHYSLFWASHCVIQQRNPAIDRPYEQQCQLCILHFYQLMIQKAIVCSLNGKVTIFLEIKNCRLQ